MTDVKDLDYTVKVAILSTTVTYTEPTVELVDATDEHKRTAFEGERRWMFSEEAVNLEKAGAVEILPD